MIEAVGDLWTYPADVRVITTNGTIKKDGSCVMGRGCAAEAKQRYPGIDKELGTQLRLAGNVVRWLRALDTEDVYSFPVKHNWWEKADLSLIQKSAEQLVSCITNLEKIRGRRIVVLPRPGCGNGKLAWEQVKPVLAPILDDRFHVITYA